MHAAPQPSAHSSRWPLRDPREDACQAAPAVTNSPGIIAMDLQTADNYFHVSPSLTVPVSLCNLARAVRVAPFQAVGLTSLLFPSLRMLSSLPSSSKASTGIKHRPDGRCSGLPLLSLCRKRRWVCTLLASLLFLLLVLFFATPRHKLHRAGRWLQNRIKERQVLGGVLPPAWLRGRGSAQGDTGRSHPTDLLSSVLQSCRREGLQSQAWEDTGEMVLDSVPLFLPLQHASSEKHPPEDGAQTSLSIASLPIFSINCVGQESRLQSLRASLTAAGFSDPQKQLQVLPCETLLDVQEECLMKSGLLTRNGLRRGEAAVALSHIRMWQAAVEQAAVASGTGTGYHALFVEDDAVFTAGAVEKLQKAVRQLQQQGQQVHSLSLWNGDWLFNTERSQQRVYREEEEEGEGKGEGREERGGEESLAEGEQQQTATLQLWQALGKEPYVAGAVAYLLSIPQAQLLLQHAFPIDKPLDYLLATGSGRPGGHFLTQPVEPRSADKRVRRGSPLVWTGGHDSLNLE